MVVYNGYVMKDSDDIVECARKLDPKFADAIEEWFLETKDDFNDEIENRLCYIDSAIEDIGNTLLITREEFENMCEMLRDKS